VRRVLQRNTKRSIISAAKKHDPMALLLKRIKLKKAAHRVWFY
jgi:hypothetical protein